MKAELYAADDGSRMRDALCAVLGESKLRFWPLVDQLLFCEEVEEDPLRQLDMYA